jgi:hypothetical protein
MHSCFLIAASFTFCSCIHRDWGRGIQRISFIPNILEKLAQSNGKAVRLSEGQIQELLTCLAGPAKRAFEDNKYIKYKKDIWAVYWRNSAGVVQADRVYLVHYSLDDSCYMALAFDSSGMLTETVSAKRGFESYDPLDKGPIQ